MKRDEHDERVDLSALDPFSEQAHADRFVGRVLERSALELARRRRIALGELPWAGGSVFGVMAGWARPALAAAVVTAVLSALVLRYDRARQEASAGVVEALAVPAPVEQWLIDERPPATADLVLTLERGTAW